MDATRSIRCLLLATALAGASLLVSACYPRPHKFTSSPEVSGVLLRGGLPVSGARVLIAHTRGDDGNYCRDGSVVALTTEDGRFHIGAHTNLHLFTSVLNAPKDVGQMTSVCFDLPQRPTLGVLLLSPSDRETSYVLSCDLESPPREYKQQVIWPKDKWGICGNGS
jgi:hypothetical protein